MIKSQPCELDRRGKNLVKPHMYVRVGRLELWVGDGGG